MTNEEFAYLGILDPDAYGTSLPRELAHKMRDRGWVEWRPPKFGTTLWAITAKGKAAFDKELAHRKSIGDAMAHKSQD